MTGPARQEHAPLGDLRWGQADRRMVPHASEEDVQASIIEWFVWATPGLVPIAIGNGGLRSKTEAARMKRTGTLAGAPDIVVALPGARTLWLETKTEIGRLSAAQIRVHAALRSIDHIAEVVRSIDDVREVLRRLGIETREAA